VTSIPTIASKLTKERALFVCGSHGWACYGNPCPKCRTETVSTGSHQLDFALRLRVERATANLPERHAKLIAGMDGEHTASDLGWVTSNTTVQMRAVNRDGVLIERSYRGGRNVYRLTTLGKAARARALSVRTHPQKEASK